MKEIIDEEEELELMHLNKKKQTDVSLDHSESDEEFNDQSLPDDQGIDLQISDSDDSVDTGNTLELGKLRKPVELIHGKVINYLDSLFSSFSIYLISDGDFFRHKKTDMMFSTKVTFDLLKLSYFHTCCESPSYGVISSGFKVNVEKYNFQREEIEKSNNAKIGALLSFMPNFQFGLFANIYDLSPESLVKNRRFLNGFWIIDEFYPDIKMMFGWYLKPIILNNLMLITGVRIYQSFIPQILTRSDIFSTSSFSQNGLPKHFAKEYSLLCDVHFGKISIGIECGISSTQGLLKFVFGNLFDQSLATYRLYRFFTLNISYIK